MDEDQAELGTLRWFGRRWDAPAFPPAGEVETPVGAICLMCVQEVAADDPGVTMPYAAAGGPPTTEALHTECFLRQIMGSVAHQERRCSCFGGDAEEDMTRESGVELLEWMIARRMGRWAA